jgi:hypothetical protein
MSVAGPECNGRLVRQQGSATSITSVPVRVDSSRVPITTPTLRRDRWWLQPVLTDFGLLAFVIYATWVAVQNAHYYVDPYISPFYSPCIADNCPVGARTFHAAFAVPSALSPALIVLIFPLGFRVSCYYYRKAYYRSFWGSPPACAVSEPHRRYTGQTRLPLILQRAHRYFFFFGVLFALILTYDAVVAFDFGGHVGVGVGTLLLVINAVLIWGYSLGCHSCRHIVGGRLRAFSRHRVRYRLWSLVSLLNGKHMQRAWSSLVWIALTDVYIRLVAGGAIADPRLF